MRRAARSPVTRSVFLCSARNTIESDRVDRRDREQRQHDVGRPRARSGRRHGAVRSATHVSRPRRARRSTSGEHARRSRSRSRPRCRGRRSGTSGAPARRSGRRARRWWCCRSMSKLRSALIVVSTNATTISLRRPGQRDGEELAHGAGAVDPRGVVERGRDLLRAGHEQHHAEAEGDPGADHADGGQRPGEVAQPAGRGAASRGRSCSSTALSGPVVGVDPDERLRDHDAGDRLRQEEHRAEEREAAHADAASASPAARGRAASGTNE